MNYLGRRIPTDFVHVERHPFSTVASTTVAVVNKTMTLPRWHWTHDQGAEGACVGFGTSMMMSLLNRRRYDCRWLWNESKLIDEWPDTNPGDDNGTSVRAACDVLRGQGHKHVSATSPDIKWGIESNKWAKNVDEMRTGLSMGIPISIGVNWYSNFDTPTSNGGTAQDWIGVGDLGSIRGGHCACIYGANDRRQAFRVKNSWGRNYPLVWLPYTTMQRLLDEYGEATLVVDRP